MPELSNILDELLKRWDLVRLPSTQRIVESMDPIAWTLVLLLSIAIVVGILFVLDSRRTFVRPDEVEATPDVLLRRLKRDPLYLTPAAIINRLGAEATLDLLEYGDQITARDWRFRWSGIREELIRLLSKQDAFGPSYALARYYRSTDTEEPDTLRIRRTALIHKLGQRLYLEPNPDGTPAQLRVHRHPFETPGDLGFEGSVEWLNEANSMERPTEGPLIAMEPIDFQTVEIATVNLIIRRTPVVGGIFRLHLKKRRKMWIVVDEEIQWVG